MHITHVTMKRETVKHRPSGMRIESSDLEQVFQNECLEALEVFGCDVDVDSLLIDFSNLVLHHAYYIDAVLGVRVAVGST